MRYGTDTTTITFRCEGCGTRVVSAHPPHAYSSLATGCSLACTLTVLTATRDAYKAARTTRTYDPAWLAVIAAAGMRPTQWLATMEQMYRVEVGRVQDLAHRARLERESPDVLAALDQWWEERQASPPP